MIVSLFVFQDESEKVELPAQLSESQKLIDEVNRLLGRPSTTKQERIRQRDNEEKQRLLQKEAETQQVSQTDQEDWPTQATGQSSAVKGTLGVHFKEEDDGGINVSDWVNKPQTVPTGSVFVSQPQHWLTLNDDELLTAEIENYIQQLESNKKDLVRPNEKLATAYRQRLYSRTGLRNPQPASRPENVENMHVEGMCTRTRPRMRTAGTVPSRAQSSGPMRMLIKQQEMLRRAPASARRTAPSIPTAHSAYGTRTPRPGQQYQTEHELQARKHPTPRYYMETSELSFSLILAFELLFSLILFTI